MKKVLISILTLFIIFALYKGFAPEEISHGDKYTVFSKNTKTRKMRDKLIKKIVDKAVIDVSQKLSQNQIYKLIIQHHNDLENITKKNEVLKKSRVVISKITECLKKDLCGMREVDMGRPLNEKSTYFHGVLLDELNRIDNLSNREGIDISEHISSEDLLGLFDLKNNFISKRAFLMLLSDEKNMKENILMVLDKQNMLEDELKSTIFETLSDVNINKNDPEIIKRVLDGLENSIENDSVETVRNMLKEYIGNSNYKDSIIDKSIFIKTVQSFCKVSLRPDYKIIKTMMKRDLKIQSDGWDVSKEDISCLYN